MSVLHNVGLMIGISKPSGSKIDMTFLYLMRDKNVITKMMTVFIFLLLHVEARRSGLNT